MTAAPCFMEPREQLDILEQTPFEEATEPRARLETIELEVDWSIAGIPVCRLPIRHSLNECIVMKIHSLDVGRNDMDGLLVQGQVDARRISRRERMVSQTRIVVCLDVSATVRTSIGATGLP